MVTERITPSGENENNAELEQRVSEGLGKNTLTAVSITEDSSNQPETTDNPPETAPDSAETETTAPESQPTRPGEKYISAITELGISDGTAEAIYYTGKAINKRYIDRMVKLCDPNQYLTQRDLLKLGTECADQDFRLAAQKTEDMLSDKTITRYSATAEQGALRQSLDFNFYSKWIGAGKLSAEDIETNSANIQARFPRISHLVEPEARNAQVQSCLETFSTKAVRKVAVDENRDWLAAERSNLKGQFEATIAAEAMRQIAQGHNHIPKDEEEAEALRSIFAKTYGEDYRTTPKFNRAMSWGLISYLRDWTISDEDKTASFDEAIVQAYADQIDPEYKKTDEYNQNFAKEIVHQLKRSKEDTGRAEAMIAQLDPDFRASNLDDIATTALMELYHDDTKKEQVDKISALISDEARHSFEFNDKIASRLIHGRDDYYYDRRAEALSALIDHDVYPVDNVVAHLASRFTDSYFLRGESLAPYKERFKELRAIENSHYDAGEFPAIGNYLQTHCSAELKQAGTISFATQEEFDAYSDQIFSLSDNPDVDEYDPMQYARRLLVNRIRSNLVFKNDSPDFHQAAWQDLPVSYMAAGLYGSDPNVPIRDASNDYSVHMGTNYLGRFKDVYDREAVNLILGSEEYVIGEGDNAVRMSADEFYRHGVKKRLAEGFCQDPDHKTRKIFALPVRDYDLKTMPYADSSDIEAAQTFLEKINIDPTDPEMREASFEGFLKICEHTKTSSSRSVIARELFFQVFNYSDHLSELEDYIRENADPEKLSGILRDLKLTNKHIAERNGGSVIEQFRPLVSMEEVSDDTFMDELNKAKRRVETSPEFAATVLMPFKITHTEGPGPVDPTNNPNYRDVSAVYAIGKIDSLQKMAGYAREKFTGANVKTYISSFYGDNVVDNVYAGLALDWNGKRCFVAENFSETGRMFVYRGDINDPDGWRKIFTDTKLMARQSDDVCGIVHQKRFADPEKSVRDAWRKALNYFQTGSTKDIDPLSTPTEADDFNTLLSNIFPEAETA